MVAKHRGPQKPRHIAGYSASHTDLCERTLITIIANLGPWRECVYLVGGLAPKYLISGYNEAESAFVPTMDVDLVLDLTMLAEVEAYRKLVANLEHMGFRRDRNDADQAVNFRWLLAADERTTVVVDLLCDAEANAGMAVKVEKGLSALAIPGAHLAYKDFVSVQISGELLGGRDVTTESLRVVNVVPFVVLKALAYDHRREEKDAHDLIYVLREYPGGPDEVATQFARRLKEWSDEPQLIQALELVRTHFGSNSTSPGHQKNGCISFGRFHVVLGDSGIEARLRNEAAGVANRFLAKVAEAMTASDKSPRT